MIISNSCKYVYMHIPKCGGTAISRYLGKRKLIQDINLNRNRHAGWGQYLDAVKAEHGIVKHSTINQIVNAMRPSFAKDYYFFTFSRNPFSRAYSVFTFTKKSGANHSPDSARYQEIKDMTFEQFLQSSHMQDKTIFAAKLQSHWLRNSPVDVDVLRLEDVDKEIGRILKRFHGIDEPTATVPSANHSAGRDDWKSMSREAEKMVLELYAEDFDRLDYEREVPRD